MEPSSSCNKLKHKNPSLSNKISSSLRNFPTCSICLSLIDSPRRAAVIDACFHAYCLGCLIHWTKYKKTCPLCNSHFRSYFTTVTSSSSSTTFQKHSLLSPSSPPRRRDRVVVHPWTNRRALGRRREEINEGNRRSRPVRRRRSFGRFEALPPEVIAKKLHEWRASIYKLGLRAVPFTDRNLSYLNCGAKSAKRQILGFGVQYLDSRNNEVFRGIVSSAHAVKDIILLVNFRGQGTGMSNSYRESVLRKIEPWIRREFQAVLEDPDPTVIVHVATSLYLTSTEKKPGISLRPLSEDTFLAPLRPFLHEWTNLFWHELRCFAESSFNMDTYDEVVEYRRSD